MKNISLWAKKNRTKTILLLILLHIILGYFYFYTGVLFYLEEIKTPSILIPIASSLFILATLFYPVEGCQQGIYKNTFFKRKFWQGITMISAALFFIHGGNHLSRAAMANEVVEYGAESIVLDLKANQHLQKKKTRKERRSLRKFLRKRLRANIKKLRQLRKENSTWKKDLIFILALFGALALIYLLGILSCSLMCSGNEALGWIVFIGGFLLIITGLVFLFRALFVKPKKEKVEPVQG